jgi:hypothetical protein
MPSFSASDDSAIVPFGKYKDQPIEVLLADQNYREWVTSQPGLMTMLQIRYPAVFNIITIGAPTTDDTPEHNKLQALFLDHDFQYAFLELAQGESVLVSAQKYAREKYEAETQVLSDQRTELQQRIDELKDKCFYKTELAKLRDELGKVAATVVEPAVPIPTKITLDFECGYDLALITDYGEKRRRNYAHRVYDPQKCKEFWFTHWFRIELKPQIGDDFPSVLRQMKRNEADTLVIGLFESTNCTLDQVRAIFGERKIITLAQIEATVARGVWPAK